METFLKYVPSGRFTLFFPIYEEEHLNDHSIFLGLLQCCACNSSAIGFLRKVALICGFADGRGVNTPTG